MFVCRYHDQYNAVYCANTPTLDGLKVQAPRRWRTLRAHGTAVGLPSDADMGNSEVGAGGKGESRGHGCMGCTVGVSSMHGTAVGLPSDADMGNSEVGAGG